MDSMQIKDKIRVLYISDSARRGGATYSLIDMIRRLSDHVDPVVVIPGHGTLEEDLHNNGIEYVVRPFMFVYGKKGQTTEEKKAAGFVDNFNAAAELKRLVEEKKIDLIHSNSSASNVGSFLSILTGKPIVLHIREALEQYGCEYWDKNLKISLFQRADYIISISEAVRAHISACYSTDSNVIYNGIEKDSYYREIDGRVTLSDFYIAGDITKFKGQFDAIRAMQILSERYHRKNKLAIVGGGPYKSIWTARRLVDKLRLGDQCEVGSFVKDMRAFRSKYGFALICSEYEGLGRVTVEAMMAGNFVIGADTGATREIIGADGKRGLLYQYGDVDDLAKKMKDALDLTPESRLAILKNAQDYAVETFDTKRYASKIIWVYEAVLAKTLNGKKEYDSAFLSSIYKRYEDYCSLRTVHEQRVAMNTQDVGEVNERFKLTENKTQLFSDFFLQNHLKTAAIYGMGFLGCETYDILKSIGIEVIFVSDRIPDGLEYVMKVLKPEDDWEDADIIINTVVRDQQGTDNFILAKGKYKVAHIEDILGWG